MNFQYQWYFSDFVKFVVAHVYILKRQKTSAQLEKCPNLNLIKI